MSTVQSAAMRAAWAGVDAEERRRRTAAALARSVERRRVAYGILNALEASGLRVEIADDEGEETP